MERIEMAEKLVEKANITLVEAKAVLERCNWDLLDAMIELERRGALKEPGVTAASRREDTAYEMVYASVSQEQNGEPKESGRDRFRRTVRELLRKGLDNRFVVTRKEQELFNLPVLAAILIILALFWLSAILLIVGLFCGCRYSFRGADLGKEKINAGMSKATDVAQDIANQVKAAANNKSRK